MNLVTYFLGELAWEYKTADEATRNAVVCSSLQGKKKSPQGRPFFGGLRSTIKVENKAGLQEALE